MIQNESLKKSMPEEKTVHGFKVRKLPCGRFLEAVEAVGNFEMLTRESLEKLLEVPQEQIEQFENLSVDELTDVMNTFFELNNFDDFFQVLHRFQSLPIAVAGFKGGSQSENQ